jgi:hypothetical protein
LPGREEAARSRVSPRWGKGWLANSENRSRDFLFLFCFGWARDGKQKERDRGSPRTTKNFPLKLKV